ncbi:MAG: GNAT family N-acetyltransferase [Intestinibacter sp.]
MKLVENISKQKLKEISNLIGEAFVTNELFHEFGSVEERKDLVMKYMDIYVQCVYESKSLYSSDDEKAYIGLAYSDCKPIIPQLKMLAKLIFAIPYKINKKFLKHINQISDGNKKYTKSTYLEILMVCVKKECQGQGRARELVEFAKQKASERDVPLLFDTDMKEYADIYQHFGCKLYNKTTAGNGVTRYNLVWMGE